MEWRKGLLWPCLLIAIVAACVLAPAAPALAYSITGTVTAADTSLPVIDCELQVWYYDAGDAAWYRLGVYDEPGADGGYSLGVYDAGQYRVQCYNSTAYAEQWWNGAATPDLATTITVPGDVLTDIDFSLHAMKTASALNLTAPAVCAYGSVSLTGQLAESGGPALAGRTVHVQAYVGDDWQQVGSDVTDASGAYEVHAAPASTTTYRAVFDGDATYEQVTSTSAQVTPKVSLTKPSAPKTARTTTTFSVTCLLKPRHTAGTLALTFQCRHYEHGKWVTKKTVSARAADVTGASRCSARVRLTKKGAWRIVAVHKADAANASTTSAWRAVSVK